MTKINESFMKFAIVRGVFEFGEFTLKSGRVSPYFLNLGVIYKGADLLRLGRFYAAMLAEIRLTFNVIFGPAYKGIPLASITAVCLHHGHGISKAVAYNRKEAKDHGEGGRLVGAPLAGKRVMILDDVITAGTAVREAAALVQAAGGTVTGIAACFDRGEKGPDGESAVRGLEREFNLKVACIAGVNDLLSCVNDEKRAELEAYFKRYGDV